MFDTTEFLTTSNMFMSGSKDLPMNHPKAGCHLLLDSSLTTPVMVSAPHSVAHIRNGKQKFAEPDTAAIVVFLVHEIKCAGIVNIDGHRDPNFDKDKPFCDVMEETAKVYNIKAFLDLHESAPSRSYSFAIGTGYGKNVNENPDIASGLLKICEKHGISDAVVDLHPYAGAGEDRVATTMNRRSGLPAVQLEINAGFFMEGDRRYDPEKAYLIVRDMVFFLANL